MDGAMNCFRLLEPINSRRPFFVTQSFPNAGSEILLKPWAWVRVDLPSMQPAESNRESGTTQIGYQRFYRWGSLVHDAPKYPIGRFDRWPEL